MSAPTPIVTDLEQLMTLRRQLVVKANLINDRITAIDGALQRVLLERTPMAAPERAPAPVVVPRAAAATPPAERTAPATTSRVGPPREGTKRQRCVEILVPLLQASDEPLSTQALFDAVTAAGVRFERTSFLGNVLAHQPFARVGRGLYQLVNAGSPA